MLRLFSHFKPFFATSFFFLTFFRPCMYRRSALSYFRSGLPYAAAILQCARYDTKLKKIQIWQDFKGRGLKSQSLKGLAFIVTHDGLAPAFVCVCVLQASLAKLWKTMVFHCRSAHCTGGVRSAAEADHRRLNSSAA